MQTDTSLFSWEQEAYNNFGEKTQLLKHNLDLVDDTSLIDLLDNYPREWLQCFTMGYNPEDYTDWKGVHIENSSGKDILDSVKKGRFWINLIHIDQAEKKFTDAIKGIYSNIANNSPHLKDIKMGYSTLIISCPGIQVYYHIDAEANMLWHLKGEKKVCFYPRTEELSPQVELEKVVAEEKDEDLPFRKEFDEKGSSYILKAGDVVTWPMHSPHRVENLSVNVSLTTSYSSENNRRVNAVHCANYFILKKLGINSRSTDHRGLVGLVKAYSYLVLNKLGVFKHKDRTAYYKTDLVVDNSKDNGMDVQPEVSSPIFAHNN